MQKTDGDARKRKGGRKGGTRRLDLKRRKGEVKDAGGGTDWPWTYEEKDEANGAAGHR